MLGRECLFFICAYSNKNTSRNMLLYLILCLEGCINVERPSC